MISFLALKRREIFPMRPPSSNWLKEIEVFRNRDSDDSYNIPWNWDVGAEFRISIKKLELQGLRP